MLIIIRRSQRGKYNDFEVKGDAKLIDENVRQQLHFVAFLDLLGYKDFFNDKKHDVGRFLETINEALISTIDGTNQQYTHVPDVYKPKIKMFSDNILIAVRSTHKNENDFLPYLNLVRTVANIQRLFITKYRLYLRGGIAKGMFYFGEKYVFGEALIRAYEMEQSAIYPKIIIDDKYIEKIIESANKKAGRHNTFADILIDVVGKERDGSYFVNYLPTYPRDKKYDNKFQIESIFAEGVTSLDAYASDKERKIIQLHKAALLEKIHEYGSYKELFSQQDIDNRKKVILKYMWSLDYHNRVCEILGLQELMIHCDIKIDSRTLQPIVVFEK